MNEATPSLITHRPTATRELGQRIGEQLKAGSVIALIGELAAADLLHQRLCAGLGIPRSRSTAPPSPL